MLLPFLEFMPSDTSADTLAVRASLSHSPMLYIIPSAIEETANVALHAPAISSILAEATHFIVESHKAARRFIKMLVPTADIDGSTFFEYEKQTGKFDLIGIKEAFLSGKSLVLLSDAGCPGVADPGSAVVALAHANNILVVPMPGACSFIMALMASGLNGQQFAFHGYLPFDKAKRLEAIRIWEQASFRNSATQIVMDTPYRNQQSLQELLAGLKPTTQLSISSHLLDKEQLISTKKVSEWRKTQINLPKAPTVFLFQA